MVSAGLFDPMYVVTELALDFLRSRLGLLFQNSYRDGIGLRQVIRIFGHADPSERAETVVEIKRSHNVLDV